MLKNFRLGAGAVAVAAALVFGGISAQAALPSSLQSQVETMMATGSDAGKVSAVVALAQANIGNAADIAAAAVVILPDLADQIAGQIAALLPSQEARNALVQAVLVALGNAYPDLALEIGTLVVAAVPGSETVLQTLIQTAAGGPFGDPVPLSPGEPVGPRFQNQTFDQIPFYDEVTQTTVAPGSTSAFEETDGRQFE